MIAEAALNGISLGGGGDQSEVANSGDMDVIFSAPFYTGIFLSSRRLQGKYGEHQEIVVRGMPSSLRWSYPVPGCGSWNGTVSPLHFIGCNVTEKSNSEESGLDELDKQIKASLSGIEKLETYSLKVKSLEVKFYEFAFGSVSIRLTGLKLSKDVKDSSENFEKLLTDCERRMRRVLNCVVRKATSAYRAAVPCCIRSRDILDIDNFEKLRDYTNLYKVDEVLDIDKFVKIDSGSIFQNLEQGLNWLPFCGKFSPFISEKGDITIAFGYDKAKNEEEDYINVSKTMGVYDALGKYFNNFLFSYYNYSVRQYEAIDAPGMFSMRNRFKTRGFLEKFTDIQMLYSQSIFMMKQNRNIYFTENQGKLWNAKNRYFKIEEIWENNDEQMRKLENWYQQVSNVSAHVSIMSSADFSLIAILFSLVIAGVLIALNSFASSANMIEKIWFEEISVLGNKIQNGANYISIEYASKHSLWTWGLIVILAAIFVAFIIFTLFYMPNFARSRKRQALSKSAIKILKKEYNDSNKKSRRDFKKERKKSCQNKQQCHDCKS